MGMLGASSMVVVRVPVANPAALLTVTVTNFVPVVVQVKLTASESEPIFGWVIGDCPSACHV